MLEAPEYVMIRKLDELTEILHKQIKWRKDHKALEKEGKIDSSYVYDTAIEQFEQLSRGECNAILAILSTWE